MMFGGDWVNDIMDTGEISADPVPLYLRLLSALLGSMWRCHVRFMDVEIKREK